MPLATPSRTILWSTWSNSTLLTAQLPILLPYSARFLWNVLVTSHLWPNKVIVYSTTLTDAMLSLKILLFKSIVYELILLHLNDKAAPECAILLSNTVLFTVTKLSTMSMTPPYTISFVPQRVKILSFMAIVILDM